MNRVCPGTLFRWQDKGEKKKKKNKKKRVRFAECEGGLKCEFV